MWLVGVGVGLVLAVWAAILLARPLDWGVWVLGLGVILQNVMLGALVIPAVGPLGNYLAAWKELCVLVLVAGLALASRRVGTFAPIPLVAFGVLNLVQLSVYLTMPNITLFTGITPASDLARLASFRQWAVPLELLVLGWLLARGGLSVRTLSAAVRVFGSVTAGLAIFGLILIPVESWAALNYVIGSGLAADDSSTSGQVEGLRTYFFGVALPRAVAPFGSPLALSFSLILPICLAAAHRETGRVPWRLLFLMTAMLLTQTRAVILALLLVWVIRKIWTRKFSSVAKTAAVGGVILTVGPIGSAIMNTVTLEDPSSRVHSEALVLGAVNLLDRPLGIGLGQGGQIGRALGTAEGGGENLFLVAGNERGWIGLALVLGLIISCLYVVRSARRRVESSVQGTPEVLAFLDAVAWTIWVLVLASLTTEHAIAFTSSWMAWVSIGWVSGLAVVSRKLPVLRSPRREFASGAES